MKQIKMIVTDLDGTLLTDDKRISEPNLQAIHNAVSRNIYFVPATGRTLHTLPENILELDCVNYIITSNGAAIVNIKTGETVYKKQLSSKTGADIIDFAEKLGVMVEIFIDGRAYVLKKFTDDLVYYGVNPKFVKWYMDTRNVVDKYDYLLKNDTTLENINIIFNDFDKKVEMQELLTSSFEVEITNSIGNNLEVGEKGCSKGTAIEELIKIFGLKMDEIMCLGDNANDFDMIKRAGLGIAMDNGEEQVKAVADYIARSNNSDGFAEAVYKFVLNEG